MVSQMYCLVCPDMSISCKKSRSYYIRSMDDFDNAKQSIMNECDQKLELNSRAHIQ